MISDKSYDLNKIYALNIEQLAKDGWKLKDETLYTKDLVTYQIYTKAVKGKLTFAKKEKIRVEFQQKHLVNDLNADLFKIIVKSLNPKDIFSLSKVDKKLELSLLHNVKEQNNIWQALIQANKNLDLSLKISNTLDMKLLKLNFRLAHLMKPYNLIMAESILCNIQKKIKKNTRNEKFYENFFKEPDEHRRLKLLKFDHAVKLFSDLSKISTLSLSNYLKNNFSEKDDDSGCKFQIDFFLNNFQDFPFEFESEGIKYHFKKFLDVIRLKSLINHNEAIALYQKFIDFTLNYEDPFMLIDRDLINFFVSENFSINNHHKFNAKNLNNEIYSTSLLRSIENLRNSILNEGLSLSENSKKDIKIKIDSDKWFNKQWRECRHLGSLAVLQIIFNLMVALKPDVILRKFKEKITYVGLNSDFFLVRMIKWANDLSTAIKIVNLIDDPNTKLKALDLCLYDYSILKPR